MLLTLVPGGWPAIVADARAAGKLQLVSWSWDLTVPYTFWAGMIGGSFFDNGVARHRSVSGAAFADLPRSDARAALALIL